jgi:hypothetical protein
MTVFVDIVNFNSDASCLPATTWLNSLGGGKNSPLYRWLMSYVTYEKRIVLGLMGAAIADLATWNPETLDLINAHPEVFQLILRPFIHDIALLRSPKGFELNFLFGRKSIEREFEHVCPFFLPPEFMLTSEQVHYLSEVGVKGTFINASRFAEDMQRRIPDKPYRVKGVLGSELLCIPCEGKLTVAFLESLYGFDGTGWNNTLLSCTSPRIFSWRDGESAFLIPEGIEREENWLRSESRSIRREFLQDLAAIGLHSDKQGQNHFYRSYPVHSFTRWMKEFRMLGFVQRIQAIERKLERFSIVELGLWLQTINSDILSAVEKPSPTVRLGLKNRPGPVKEHVIKRSERGFEGEDYLALLEGSLRGERCDHLDRSPAAHIEKVRARIRYLGRLTA